jgi:lactate dehydrogenase-like 2-hydroxyacid dehydrogenase
MKDLEKQMYGNTLANIKESIENSITYKLSGIGMIVCGYMSDIQEMNEHNVDGHYTEQIRQTLNICKMLMMEYNLGFKEREAA